MNGDCMGTDCYLKWDKMTKAEEKKQVTGFSIDAGGSGYIRASIGMVNENALLRVIFPEEYWNAPKPKSYDFIRSYGLLSICLQRYLKCAKEGIRIELKDIGFMMQKESLDKITEALSVFGFDEIKTGSSLDLDSAVIWAKSLVDFFQLGIRLQVNEQNPKIYISW